MPKTIGACWESFVGGGAGSPALAAVSSRRSEVEQQRVFAVDGEPWSCVTSVMLSPRRETCRMSYR